MADLLPSTPDTSAADEADPRVIGLDSEDADQALSALTAQTARTVLGELHDDPATPSALATRVDTSLQNVQYHLGKLEDAGLIEPIDTVYSEKGREMKVYAPADRPLVVFAAPEAEQTGLRAALSRLLGGVGILAIVSVLIETFLGDGFPLPWFGGTGGAAGGGSGEADVMMTTSDAAAASGGLPPGLLFFFGGLSVLLLGFSVWYIRRRWR